MQKALSAQRKKTDRNDARGIAHMMRVGWFRQVHVKSSESQHLRVLLSNRRLLKRKFIDVENEVRGTLKAFGIKIGKVSRGQFEGRAMELVEAAQPLLQDLVRGMLQVRRITYRGRTLRAHAQTVPIRHHRLRWPYHTLWGRRGAHCALRGGERLGWSAARNGPFCAPGAPGSPSAAGTSERSWRSLANWRWRCTGCGLMAPNSAGHERTERTAATRRRLRQQHDDCRRSNASAQE